MTINSFIEYLKFKWKARGRHGIHSPFVYAFVEDVIQERKKLPVVNTIEFPGIPERYALLLKRMVMYYRLELQTKWPDDPTINGDTLLLLTEAAAEWFRYADKYFHLLQHNSAVFIPDIHQTALHTTAWNNICRHPKVMMSIDLYGAGLVFFRNEFKEKQHFVLKHP